MTKTTNSIITISRQYGSGGSMIGQMIAKQLNIPFYDKEIITLASQQSGLDSSVIEEHQQKKTSSFLYSLYLYNVDLGLPMSEQVFMAQSRVIKKVAAEGPCVILGRCADFILKGYPNAKHVYVYAPFKERLERVSSRPEATGRNLETMLKKEDKKRSSYYDYFTGQKWGDPKHYHLCINSCLGFEKAVDTILTMAK